MKLFKLNDKASDKRVKKEQNKKWKKSRFGIAPYKRAYVSSLIAVIIGIILSFSSLIHPSLGFDLKIPKSTLEPWGMVQWIISNSIVPHFLIFSVVFVCCMSILSMGNSEYLKWVTKKSLGGALLTYLLFESTICLILLIVIHSMPVDNFSVINSDNGSSAQVFMQSFTTMTLIFPPWLGYRTAWRAYREIGAQTVSDRWKKHSRKIARKNSGRAWEKLVTSPFSRIFGLTGEKPRYGFLWVFIIAPIVLSISQSFGALTGSYIGMGLATITILPAIIPFFAARAKVKDGMPDSLGVLDIRRTEESEDSFSVMTNVDSDDI